MIETVSVPYWGSLYFNRERGVNMTVQDCFRPLLGFFIFQYLIVLTNQSIVSGFRPLLGFFIFQYIVKIILIIILTVSVPYWGSLYFNFLSLIML